MLGGMNNKNNLIQIFVFHTVSKLYLAFIAHVCTRMNTVSLHSVCIYYKQTSLPCYVHVCARDSGNMNDNDVEAAGDRAIAKRGQRRD